MPKLRVHNLSISIDGYVAGPSQDVDNPLGVGGPMLHEWVFKTRTGLRMLGEQGGDEGIESALERAFEAADGMDVRLGGGASTVQQYLQAGLIDEIGLAVVPIFLGSGERLFDHLDGGPTGYECMEMVCSPAVTHARFVRIK